MNPINAPEDNISFESEDKITYDFALTIIFIDGNFKFKTEDFKTSLIGPDDRFIDRIQFENLNPYFLEKHISKEIEIKNKLDDAVSFLNNEKYPKAINLLDEVIYYDADYAEALLYKSKALFGQGHFVKSLRHYKRAVKADPDVNDGEYHKLLLRQASGERDSFPKIKRNIYAGDEFFSKGEYEQALVSYDKALANPSKFKDKILSKLLNKKATALINLNRIDEAMEVFRKSVSVKANDYAYFYIGIYSDALTPEIQKASGISKKQLLVKAGRLNDFGESNMALDCLDEFFSNHFTLDDDYRTALNLKLDILKKLEKDTSDVENILKSI